jgi:hypothetical protein
LRWFRDQRWRAGRVTRCAYEKVAQTLAQTFICQNQYRGKKSPKV